MLALVEAGLERQKAYVLVQRNAMRTWNGEGDFMSFLLSDGDVCEVLPEEDIRACFAMAHHLKHVDSIFERVFG